jgi:GTPase involved in cell partitioning and DNA repair
VEIYEPSLLNKERLIIGTKKDLDEMGERGMIFEETFKSLPHIQVSIFTREGMEDLKTLFLSLAK